eukprot:6913830-Alexandrium_andersonii.AAC.1
MCIRDREAPVRGGSGVAEPPGEAARAGGASRGVQGDGSPPVRPLAPEAPVGGVWGRQPPR